MPHPSPPRLEPRKTPRQSRSTATVEAIFAATIQVLLTDGETQLTTTRVAERAGVSVGTMYQYFPNKQALLYAVLQQRLGAVVEAIEAAAARLAGQPLMAISDGLVAAWLEAKTRDIAVSQALYAVSADFDIAGLMSEGSQRMRKAVEQLLTSAADATFAQPGSVSLVLLAVLGGSVRSALERGAVPAALATLRAELPVLCRAYLLASAAYVPQI